MELAVAVPIPVDANQANLARIYSYWLGGSEYRPVDQQAADNATVAQPRTPYLVRTHRAFLHRVVHHLATSGVRQFLDLGSGIPDAGHVHHIAHAVDPDCRVVYVDNDPIAVRSGRALLAAEDTVTMLHADLRQPEQILASPQCRALLNLDEPTAVLLIDSLLYIADGDHPQRVITTYRQALCPGSYLALSHSRPDDELAAGFARIERMFHVSIPPLTLRDRAQTTCLVEGFEVLEPGIVTVPQWPSNQELHANPDSFPGLAVLARKA